MAKISHGKKPREILFIDQLLIYSGLFPVEILSAGTVAVLNGRCAEGFGEAFACGFKMLFCCAARKLLVERHRKQLAVFVKLRIKFAGAVCGLHDVLR